MEAAWAMTGFAAHVKRVWAGRHETRVIRRGDEVSVDFFMALLAVLGTDVLGAGNHGKAHHRTSYAGASNHRDNYGEERETDRKSPASSREQLIRHAAVTMRHAIPVLRRLFGQNIIRLCCVFVLSVQFGGDPALGGLQKGYSQRA